MSSILVRLQPVAVELKDQAGKALSIVTKCDLSFEVRGDSTPLADHDAKSATLEFFEVKGGTKKGDKPDQVKQDRRIASLNAALLVKGGVPVLTTPSGANLSDTVQHDPLVEDKTDFFVSVRIAEKNRDNFLDEFLLFLPWEVFTEQKKIEVQARLSVDGTLMAKPRDNDTLDLPLRHAVVPRDGTDVDRFESFGIRVVYPRGSDQSSKAIKKEASKSLEIVLHTSVREVCNSLAKNSFDEKKLGENLSAIFTDVGFAAPTLRIVDDAVASTHFHRERTDSEGNVVEFRWCAANMDDPIRLARDSGTALPFFTFWVFHDPRVTTSGQDWGNSEALNELQPIGKTKHVLFPIIIPGDVGSMPFDAYGNLTDNEARMNALATLIAHEIGHSFGLRHGLAFDEASKGYSYGGTHNTLPVHTRGVMTALDPRNGEFPLKKFGPVHTKELRAFL